jgi:hypothetical protein
MRILAVALSLLLYSAAAFAQQPTIPAGRDRAVAVVATPIMLEALNTRPPVRVAAIGTSFILLRDLGDWLEVQYLDPQLGLRVGFVRAVNVRIERAASLQPADLSVPRDPQQSPPVGRSAPLPPPTTAPQITLPETRAVPNRVHLDADFLGFFPLKRTQTATLTRTQFGQTATAAAAYAVDNAWSAIPEPSVRVLLGSQWAVGFRFLRYEMNFPAGIAVSVPHPTVQNRLGTDDGITTHIMERRDWMFDFNFAYIRNEEKWRYVVSAGPSYFRSTDDRVSTIAYIQNSPSTGANTVFITGSQWTTVTGSGFGGNASTDISFYAWPHVGVGAGAFLDLGYARIDDPLTDKKEKVNMGSVTLMFGPRFRF